MADYADNNGGVILDGPFDPDAQATVTDYIDYTEFLPADLMRSLTLIRGLDERYLESTQTVHELTKTFGHLPSLPTDVRPSAQSLRRDISIQLDRALNARESAYAEACRLYDVVDRHFNRLDCIKQKLNALPKPSAEPAPAPAQPPKRSRTGKRGDATPTPRITLRLDGDKQKSRSRRSLAASGHLAPLNPDSPIASTEQSDAEPETKPELRDAPVDGETALVPSKRRDKQSRRARPVVSGNAPQTNMSTSGALALLKPPVEGAKPGCPDMPWLRLTEWEMTNLRRKMKKNAVWQPSEVMVHRELALRGRGWEAYRAAKAAAERNGEEFVDCDDIMNTYIPGQLTRRGEGSQENISWTETKLSNRGMKLNEAKRLKRENMAREQAAAAAAEAEAAKRLGAGKGKAVLPTSGGQPTEPSKGKSTRSSKKRKHEEDSAVPDVQPDLEPTTSLRISTKRQKTGKEPSVKPTASPTAPATMAEVGPSAIKQSPRSSPATARRTSTRAATTAAAPRPTSVPKNVNTPTPPNTRPSSRRLSAAVLTDLPTAASRELRHKSATPARRTPIPEGVNRRRKRPAPGPVSSSHDGGAAVSYGRRKAKPTKKKIPREHGQKETSLPPNQDIRIDEDGVLEEIDPNEPRYCVCGDVSFGTMICCENPDVRFSFPPFRIFLAFWLMISISVTGNGSISIASASRKSPVALLNGTVPIAGSSSIKVPMGSLGLGPVVEMLLYV